MYKMKGANKKMTNYEHIKNMSVEEMAMQIYRIDVDCQEYCAYTKDGVCDKYADDDKGNCIDGIKLWLEQEVEE